MCFRPSSRKGDWFAIMSEKVQNHFKCLIKVIKALDIRKWGMEHPYQLKTNKARWTSIQGWCPWRVSWPWNWRSWDGIQSKSYIKKTALKFQLQQSISGLQGRLLERTPNMGGSQGICSEKSLYSQLCVG